MKHLLLKTHEKSQIIGAMDSTYIKELINSSTETILHDIPQIFTFLFDQYGHIKYEYLNQEENKIENFTFHITNPPIDIFNAIEDLVSPFIAAKLPKLQQHIITCGLNILKNTVEFDTSFTKWYNLP